MSSTQFELILIWWSSLEWAHASRPALAKKPSTVTQARLAEELMGGKRDYRRMMLGRAPCAHLFSGPAWLSSSVAALAMITILLSASDFGARASCRSAPVRLQARPDTIRANLAAFNRRPRDELAQQVASTCATQFYADSIVAGALCPQRLAYLAGLIAVWLLVCQPQAPQAGKLNRRDAPEQSSFIQILSPVALGYTYTVRVYI